MKVRTDYVSNSSSSSFILAYDKKFFGDLEKFFTKTEIGYETSVQPIEEFFDGYDDNEGMDWLDEVKEKVKAAKKAKKSLVLISLDYDYCALIELLKTINKNNGGDKFEVIYEDR